MASYDDDEFEERPRKKKSPSGSAKKSPKKKTSRPSSGPSIGLVIGLIAGGVVAVAVLIVALLPVVRKFRLESQRPLAEKRMKQLGLAMHNYHDSFARFPPGGVAREGEPPLIGWEARLLPYADYAPLYQQINWDHPWNSPQNEPVFSQQVLAFQNPALQSSTEANASHVAGSSHIFSVNKSHKISDTTDGTSNTLAIGEVSAGFKHWGDPSNVRDPTLGLGSTAEQFGGPFQGGTYFLIMDGSVRFLKSDIDPQILKALATPQGNESLDF